MSGLLPGNNLHWSQNSTQTHSSITCGNGNRSDRHIPIVLDRLLSIVYPNGPLSGQNLFVLLARQQHKSLVCLGNSINRVSTIILFLTHRTTLKLRRGIEAKKKWDDVVSFQGP